MIDVRKQAVTGLVPPQQGEAKIREAWPSVTATCSPAASAGRKLMLSRVGAPFGWALLLPVYFWKLRPFGARRYTLTNRRLMIQSGLRPAPRQEVPLAEIEDVRVVRDANSAFYRAATLEIIAKGGQVVLTLPGVPEPESFRQAILNACRAWAGAKAAVVHQPFIPASAMP
jgi:hypothetical protein